jgi:antirestriction protein ArdC
MSYKGKWKGAKASDERRDIHAEITAKIIADLEAGTVPWLKPWETGARFSGMPRNAVSKRRYSGINVVLLWMTAQDRGYVSSEWLTFKQAKELGGSVKAGEKGTTVVFYKQLSFAEKTESGDVENRSVMMAKAYTVFNVEQCDGLKLKEAPAPVVCEATPEGLDAAYMLAVKRTGATIEHHGAEAYYAPARDIVVMPPVALFKDCAGYQATLAHELVHWTGHKSRLDRFDGVPNKIDYAFEELVAELGAAYTCAEFNIRGELRHAGYIKSWIAHLKQDKRAILRAASRASRAVAFLYPTAEEIDTSDAAEPMAA